MKPNLKIWVYENVFALFPGGFFSLLHISVIHRGRTSKCLSILGENTCILGLMTSFTTFVGNNLIWMCQRLMDGGKYFSTALYNCNCNQKFIQYLNLSSHPRGYGCKCLFWGWISLFFFASIKEISSKIRVLIHEYLKKLWWRDYPVHRAE